MNPPPFLDSKKQAVYNQVSKEMDLKYVKVKTGLFDPEAFLFTDERYLAE